MKTGAEGCGRYYWCIKGANISQDGEIYLFADEVEVKPGGELIFWRPGDPQRPQRCVNLIIAPGQWKAVFAASVLDGHAIAVEHWKGEIIEEERDGEETCAD